MGFVMPMYRLIFLLCWVSGAALSEDCVHNKYCHCVKEDFVHDLHCQMTFPFLEVTGNDILFRTFYLSADTDHSRVEGIFRNIHVNKLVITGNSVTDLDCHLLRGLNGLLSVDIVDTKLSRIPTCTFHENANIASLSIINSQINELPRRAFAVLPNIKRIVLSHNCLTHIRLDTFYGVDHLTSLDLSFNCLSGAFTSEPLSHLTKLTYLNLSHNSFSSLNIASINLDDLNIMKPNYLSETKPKLTRMCHMSFAWNQIRTIVNFQIQVKPTASENMSIEVDLSHNELQTIPEVALDEPKQNRISIDLDISHNRVRLFDKDPVSCNFCRNVILLLSIAYNKLESFPVCHLHILQKYNSQLFNFSHNVIDGGVNRLCGAEDLYVLDVSSNRLTIVGELGIKGKTTRMRELYMSSNLISTIEKSEMNNVVGTLKLVDLTNNALFDYQQILDSFPTTLNLVRLAENPFDCRFTDLIWGNGTICELSKIHYGARCAKPIWWRGMQVLCLPIFNCSNMPICMKDTHMELALKGAAVSGALMLHWQVIGPGQDKLSEFILTVINSDLNKTHLQLFVHKSSRNIMIQPISPNTNYNCCIESVIFNISTEQSCYHLETGDDTSAAQTSSTALIVGLTFGISAFLLCMFG